MLGSDDGQPLMAVLRLEQSVAFITQQRDEGFAVRREVVNDQNGCHGPLWDEGGPQLLRRTSPE